MLQLEIPQRELFNEETQEFVNLKATVLTLEHSLVSLSKWESKWEKPFLSKEPRTDEETIDYIKCMTITQNVDERVYEFMSPDIIDKITKYISANMTATWLNDAKDGSSGTHKVITSEIIYYRMIEYNIPFECQKWHLNRLLTLIRVCNEYNAGPKKVNMREEAARRRELNLARKAQYNTKG